MTRVTENRKVELAKRTEPRAHKWAGMFRSKKLKVDEIHAVTGVNELGARTSACGMTGRFVPVMGGRGTTPETPGTRTRSTDAGIA